MDTKHLEALEVTRTMDNDKNRAGRLEKPQPFPGRPAGLHKTLSYYLISQIASLSKNLVTEND